MPTDQALVLAAHGSHHDACSAAPVYALADRLRERGGFDAVRAAFWKEQPALSAVVSTVPSGTVYVVPVMTSEGYFSDRVFPRELGLDGVRDGRRVRYTEPVGTHPGLVDVIVERVRTVTADAVDAADLGVVLVGHGTDRHAHSADATVAHADRLRADGRFAAVEAAFLDQSPGVPALVDRIDATKVVVVPLFVSNGPHVRYDVPSAIGLSTDGDPFGGPFGVGDDRVWYAEAVGTAPSVADVILDRVAEAGADTQPGGEPVGPSRSPAETAFLRWLSGDQSAVPTGTGEPSIGITRRWGELAITVVRGAGCDDRYTVQHLDDWTVPATRLDALTTPAAVRERTATDDAGGFRPLRSARTLPRGWRLETPDSDAVLACVRAVYPASIDHWHRERAGTLVPTTFDAVIDRQTGRYRELVDLGSTVRAGAVEACCGACIRRPMWLTADDVDGAPPDGGTVPCPEPCSFLLEAARSFAVTDAGAGDETIDPTVPAAAFDRPANRYRARFRRAQRRADPPTIAPGPDP